MATLGKLPCIRSWQAGGLGPSETKFESDAVGEELLAEGIEEGAGKRKMNRAKTEGYISKELAEMEEQEHHDAAAKMQALQRGNKARKTGARRDVDVLGDDDLPYVVEKKFLDLILQASASLVGRVTRSAIAAVEAEAAEGPAMAARVTESAIAAAEAGKDPPTAVSHEMTASDGSDDFLALSIVLTYEENDTGDDWEARVWLKPNNI